MDIVIRDKDFIEKVDYLRKKRGYKSRLETITNLIDEMYENERPSDCPNCKYYKDGFCSFWNERFEEEQWCTAFEKMEAST